MNEHRLELEVAWQHHVSTDRRRFESLMNRHREQHRRYHTAEHVAWVVRHVGELAVTEAIDDLDAVVAAALYHDAIYEPASPANERASARLARRDLGELGWTPDRVEHVATMIEATEEHTEPFDTDTAVLLDADLAVLAADPTAYGEYVNNVRAEYRHVDDADWTSGRAAFLQRLLERDSIFATATARQRWEERARANIAAELSTLGRHDSDSG